jgi:hypothetical protein
MLPMTVGLVFIALSIVAIVVELSLLGAAYRDVATVADIAAEAGASMLSASEAYGSHIELDVVAAEEEARRVSGTWGSGDEIVTVSIDQGRLCVTVADVYRPRTLVFIGVTEVDVSVTGCGEPRAG